MINMDREHLILYLLVLISISSAGWAAQADIHLNSLGFLPDMPKKATITTECNDFQVKTPDGEVAYQGRVTGPVFQADVNQSAWVADFSELIKPGTYYLEVPKAGRSIEFQIAPDIYSRPFYTSMRAFYLWRCGTAVEGTHNGITYKHQMCHAEDGWQDYIGIADTQRDGTGGWHDAGDYGKYTVNAGVTMGILFLAWDQHQDKLKSVSLDIPNTASGWPDFLKELKWETDWLLKMQYPDGSGKVSHKLTRQNFSGFVMPEADKEKRYYTDWSSAATADFVAVMAQAARYFKPYDPQYAQTCLDAATKSYAFLKAHPENKRADLKAFSTGAYGTGDEDDRLWAAAEMWQVTGNDEYLRDFEAAALKRRNKIDAVWDWGSVANLAMITYLFSERPGRNQQLISEIRQSLLDTADRLLEQARKDIYARPLAGRYYWGCNGTVARQTVLLISAYRIDPKPEYVHASLDAVGHLFGRNFYGRSFVTGLGHNPPMHPHDRRSGADNMTQPWPGYLVGGGETATGWHDEQEDYRTNEIAVNWQAALVYALSAFVHR